MKRGTVILAILTLLLASGTGAALHHALASHQRSVAASVSPATNPLPTQPYED